nr:hypothetical protein OG999_46760 [Streptomyces sp. NBC_00886]
MRFAAGGAFGHTALWGHLALGLAWAASFSAVGLVIFRIRTRPTARARARAGRSRVQYYRRGSRPLPTE